MARFWGVDERVDRLSVQSLRARPPGLAGQDGQRRRVFGSSLEQFDELLEAAAAVRPAAAPIPLFYALSQAGRALAAVHISDSPWRPRSHGLRVGDPQKTIGDAMLTPEASKAGSFQLFCRSIGSAPLTAPVSLGAVWAATGRFQRATGLGAGHPSPLTLQPLDGQLAGCAVLEGDAAADLPDHEAHAAVLLRERLGRYPSSRKGILRVEPDPWPGMTFATPRVVVSWRTPEGEALELTDVAQQEFVGAEGRLLLRPALADGGATLDPIAAMYASLLGLSSLARYHPDAWQAALNRDLAETAITIETAIDLARELLPYIVKILLTARQPQSGHTSVSE